MPTPLGDHLLIDFYNCLYDAISETKTIHDSLSAALENVDIPIEEFSYHHIDGEIIVWAIGAHCHVGIHAYPDLGYVAVDIFSFKSDITNTAIMKELKLVFGAQKTKATSVRRADFGEEKDMKPRYRSSFTPKGRVKVAGAKLKRTGAKVLHIITQKKKDRL